MKCKNCKWLADPEMSSVCWNDKSPHCADFVLPNDVCEAFECVELQTCKNCDYGMLNEMSDLICVNDSSERCSDFVFEHESCEHWQNHDNEILGDSK